MITLSLTYWQAVLMIVLAELGWKTGNAAYAWVKRRMSDPSGKVG